ncbi:MAG: DUF6361 family protein, partial [Acidimicrobiaceae bacterium]|nr:DUF6361 family protein [Acidimicrobiaceae bacterium]
MNAYSPASSMGWLDFDAAASERVSTLLRSLEEPSTLDVLGLGTVRDAFADMLSPGTSTVQTKLRYVIFLPWIFKRLEDDRVSAADFARRLRDHEARLIDCLRPLGSNQGVIGFRAGRDLKRMPSDIYWGSLATWGVSRLPLSLAEYGARAASLGRLQPERDDGGNATEPPMSMWAAIPPRPEKFLDSNITFELEPEEAQVLTESIRRRHPNTLIADLSKRPGLSLDGIDYPWLVPEPDLLPSRLAEVLHHARCFSELTLGPQLVYNLLLAREASQEFGWETKELEDDQLGQLEDWSGLVMSRDETLGRWAEHPGEFWQILAGYGISGTTQHFWNDSIRRAMDDPGRFAEDPMVHRL